MATNTTSVIMPVNGRVTMRHNQEYPEWVEEKNPVLEGAINLGIDLGAAGSVIAPSRMEFISAERDYRYTDSGGTKHSTGGLALFRAYYDPPLSIDVDNDGVPESLNCIDYRFKHVQPESIDALLKRVSDNGGFLTLEQGEAFVKVWDGVPRDSNGNREQDVTADVTGAHLDFSASPVINGESVFSRDINFYRRGATSYPDTIDPLLLIGDAPVAAAQQASAPVNDSLPNGNSGVSANPPPRVNLNDQTDYSMNLADGQYHILIQPVGEPVSADSRSVVKTRILIVAPDGSVQNFDANHAGHGDTILPIFMENFPFPEGFDAKTDAHKVFTIQAPEQPFVVGKFGAPYAFNQSTGDGYSLKVYTTPQFPVDGKHNANDNNLAIAFHPDGDSNQDGVTNDGSSGCYAIPQDQAVAFFNAINAIPTGQLSPDIGFVKPGFDPSAALGITKSVESVVPAAPSNPQAEIVTSQTFTDNIPAKQQESITQPVIQLEESKEQPLQVQVMSSGGNTEASLNTAIEAMNQKIASITSGGLGQAIKLDADSNKHPLGSKALQNIQEVVSNPAFTQDDIYKAILNAYTVPGGLAIGDHNIKALAGIFVENFKPESLQQVAAATPPAPAVEAQAAQPALPQQQVLSEPVVAEIDLAAAYKSAADNLVFAQRPGFDPAAYKALLRDGRVGQRIITGIEQMAESGASTEEIGDYVYKSLFPDDPTKNWIKGEQALVVKNAFIENISSQAMAFAYPVESPLVDTNSVNFPVGGRQAQNQGVAVG